MSANFKRLEQVKSKLRKWKRKSLIKCEQQSGRETSFKLMFAH